MKTIILIMIPIVLIGMLVLFYYQVLLPTMIFYEKCNNLENQIKTIDNKNEQMKQLRVLSKFNWYRITLGGVDQRINELTKMIEIKYKKKMLKY